MGRRLPESSSACLLLVLLRQFYFQRCIQPAQQHGLRIPPASLESAFLIRIPLVCTFLPDIIQQIHSLRASGVISSHTVRAAAMEERALRKSAGNTCTAFVLIFFFIIFPFDKMVPRKWEPVQFHRRHYNILPKKLHTLRHL